VLLRQSYLENKQLVDLAASLSALGVVEIKACETWMGGNSVDPSTLQPFVQTVSYGPGEVRRLVNDEGYIRF
jgi:intracellular sulfur oxidation DsrE/DsrF family protein